MAEKQQPGGFAAPSGSGFPSAPPSYQATFGNPAAAGNPYSEQQMGLMAPNNTVAYPTASGAPAYYYQQGQQNAAHAYPNTSQQFYLQSNAGYPTGAAGGPTAYLQMAGQPPTVMMGSPYPKAANVGGVQYPNTTVAGASGQFDAGARFTQYAPPSVPPPPPGYAPNMAQVAAAQGHSVVTSQKEGGFFKGSGSGGYTFW